MSAHTLLPCPFCGYPPCYRFVTNPNGGNYPGHHEIWCEALSCDVGVEVSDVNLIEAELLWNTRAVNRDHHFDALVKALEKIAAMDPKGIRADDLGRAARIAADGIKAVVGNSQVPASALSEDRK